MSLPESAMASLQPPHALTIARDLGSQALTCDNLSEAIRVIGSIRNARDEYPQRRVVGGLTVTVRQSLSKALDDLNDALIATEKGTELAAERHLVRVIPSIANVVKI